ncbi:MAG: FadR family transcriptional regulator [Lachnospiraceae bacterium]|nr:FadR family transcriptional regulator [Lachnospiraceae bacterium]
MSNLFELSKRESTVDIVVNSIKQLLIERRLKPGDKLPTELEISEGLGVSRGSVREAMKILSAFGLVDIRVGNGTYVCESPGNGLLDSFLFSFFMLNPDVANLYEFRSVLEADVLELILKHYEENLSERTALRKNLEELEEMMNSPQPNQKLLLKNDLEFHQLMGKATRNLLVERVYNFVIDFMEPSIKNTHKNQKGEYVYQVHKKTLAIIEEQDYAHISDAIAASVDTWSVLQTEELEG